MKQTAKDWKLKAFKRFGSLCNCCEEYRKEFLTFDHINGGGQKHRLGFNSLSYYKWLTKSKGVKKIIQLLCMNCNWARRNGALCPHIKEGFKRIDWGKVERKTKHDHRLFAIKDYLTEKERFIQKLPGMIMTRHVGMLRASEFEPQNESINQQMVTDSVATC